MNDCCNVSRIARFLQEIGLAILLFLLPFSKAAIEVSFAFLLSGWILARLKSQTRYQSLWAHPALRPLILSLLGFLLICILSIGVSAQVALSFKGVVDKWFEYLMLFVIIADLSTQPQLITRGLLILTSSAFLVLSEGLTQELLGRGWLRGYKLSVFTRMTGPYENPIDLATYLMVIIPILITYAKTCQPKLRTALWGLIGLLILCLARTEALGAWLGLCLGLLPIIIFHRELRRSLLTLLIVLGLSGGFVLIRIGQLHLAFSTLEIGKIDRWMMWQAALGMIRDRPILGHGINTFMANYLSYWVGGERQPRYAHNCYLQMAAETGLIGLTSFLILLWQLFAQLINRIPHLPEHSRTRLLGFIGGLLAFVLHAGIDTNFYSMRQVALFFCLAGFALGMSYSEQTAQLPFAEPASPRISS